MKWSIRKTREPVPDDLCCLDVVNPADGSWWKVTTPSRDVGAFPSWLAARDSVAYWIKRRDF